MKEEFRIVPYAPNYSVSNLGNVKNIKRDTLLKPRLLRDYKRVSLSINGKPYDKRIHRLVAEAFIPNPDNKPQINHIDGDRGNNHYTNLEWCTNSENQLHSYKVLGKDGKGIKNGNHKLSEEDVLYIRTSTEDSLTLSHKFNISRTQVYRIKSKKLWNHL